MKYICTTFVILLCIGLSLNAVAEESIETKIQAATAAIADQPNNPDSYTARMNLFNKSGRYQEAANDLAKQCSLTMNSDIKEMCEMELKEYKDLHNLK